MQQTSDPSKYEYLPHSADLKIKAQGKTLEIAISNIITALTASSISISKIKPNKEIKISIESRRLTAVVFDVCQRYLELCDTNQLIATHIEDAKITEMRGKFKFEGTFVGDEPKNIVTDEPISNPIKAPTYHEMAIETKNDIIYITIVVDI